MSDGRGQEVQGDGQDTSSNSDGRLQNEVYQRPPQQPVGRARYGGNNGVAPIFRKVGESPATSDPFFKPPEAQQPQTNEQPQTTQREKPRDPFLNPQQPAGPGRATPFLNPDGHPDGRVVDNQPPKWTPPKDAVGWNDQPLPGSGAARNAG